MFESLLYVAQRPRLQRGSGLL